jgi:anti-sigma28 factor (negative regulator of flagellin synthesis)
MKIDSLNVSNYYQDMTQRNSVGKKEESNDTVPASDRLDISDKAKKLNNLNLSSSKAKDLEEISQRIQSGYYNDNIVLDRVADSILNSEDLDSSLADKI